MGNRIDLARELQERDRAPYLDLLPDTPASALRFEAAFEALVKSTYALKRLDQHTIGKIVPPHRMALICDKYWLDVSYNESPTLVDARPHAKKVAKLIDELIDVLSAGEGFANDAICRFSSDPDMTLAQRLQMLEGWRLGCEQISDNTPSAGRRRSDHIDRAVQRLASLWFELTGKRFTKSLRPTKTGAKNFEAQHCQFTFELLQAIDPSITYTGTLNVFRRYALRR